MRVAVCDDLKEAIDELKEKLSKFSEIEGIDEFDRLVALSDKIGEGVMYDIVFMDIDWKGESINGIDFAEKLRGMPVIFVTAYPIEFAEKIFEKKFQPAGFLIKPVKQENIKVLLEKIKTNADKNKKIICLNKSGKQVIINTSDIVYLENTLHKTIIHTSDDFTVSINKNLASIKDSLPEAFIKCHKSYIVNPDYISELSSKVFMMKNGTRIPISRANSDNARIKFMEYMY